MVINEYPETLAGEETPAPADEHELHMWSPLELRIGTGYDYLGDSLFYRFLLRCSSPSRSVFSPFSIPFCSGSSSMGGKTSSVCGDGGHFHLQPCPSAGLHHAGVSVFRSSPVFRHPPVQPRNPADPSSGQGPRRHADSPQFPENARVLRRRGEAVRRGQIVQIYPEGCCGSIIRVSAGSKTGRSLMPMTTTCPCSPRLLHMPSQPACTACSNGSLACA